MPDASRRSLSPQQREAVVERLVRTLAEEPDVAFAYLYGSFLGELPFRDVDVGVYLENVDAAAPDSAAERTLEIATRLSAELEIPVDVRLLNSAPPTFAFHVLRGRRLLSRNDDLRAHVLAETARRYLDLEPLLRRATKEAFAV